MHKKIIAICSAIVFSGSAFALDPNEKLKISIDFPDKHVSIALAPAQSAEITSPKFDDRHGSHVTINRLANGNIKFFVVHRSSSIPLYPEGRGKDTTTGKHATVTETSASVEFDETQSSVVIENGTPVISVSTENSREKPTMVETTIRNVSFPPAR